MGYRTAQNPYSRYYIFMCVVFRGSVIQYHSHQDYRERKKHISVYEEAQGVSSTLGLRLYCT